MINNNKADTIFLFDKAPYPLQPVPVLKGDRELRDNLIVSVEPGTIVDPLKQKEHSVIKERKFFELRDGEALYIVADVSFPPTIKRGGVEIFEREFDDEGQPNIVKKLNGRYEIYVSRYKIKDFQIKVYDYTPDDPDANPKDSFRLAHREGNNLIHDAFPDPFCSPISPKTCRSQPSNSVGGTGSNFNQLYFDATVSRGSVSYLKRSPLKIPKPTDGSVRYFFSSPLIFL
jgi:hypothetical protein